VIALDPATGAEIWRYDPGIDRSRHYAETTSRGVSSWLDPHAAPGAPCAHRIFAGTLDGRLIALDGRTGKPCEEFADGGSVDLTKDVRLTRPGQYTITSPPVIAGDLVITGSAIGDNRAVELELGIVRAFDARTGRRGWLWDPIPRDPGDPAHAHWQPAQAALTGAANAWSILSVDAERDLVFIPTGAPSPASAKATTAMPTRSWRCGPRAVSWSGSSSWCITTSGTTTCPPSRGCPRRK